MNLPSASTHTTGNREPQSDVDTRLFGRWLILARVLWSAVVVLTLLILVAILPVYGAQLQTVCADVACAFGQLTPEQAERLQDLGLSLGGYTALNVALTIVEALVWFAVGAVLVWRKSHDWMALLVVSMLVTVGTISAAGTVQSSQSPWHFAALVLNQLAWVLLFLVFFLFPNGRFVPRWMRWLAVGWIVVNVLNFFPDVPFPRVSWLPTLLFFGFLGSLVVAQIYRYRRVSTPVQRQQTKWVVFSVMMIGLIQFGFALPLLFFPSLMQSDSLYDIAVTTVLTLSLLLIPLSIGIAMLRYHLWDIDVLINRTLVYGLLTALLALVYVGLVIGLQALLRGLTGQAAEIPLVIVGSTLVIAALFNPLRRRTQAFIDRRFYRRKYDAARTLAAFSTTLRNEVDLSQLSEQLMSVVQETMQPTHVSLWLRKPPQERKDQAWVSNPFRSPMKNEEMDE